MRDWNVVLIRVGLGVVVIVLLVAMSSCQTIRGVASDMGRLCEDVQTQIPPQPNK